MPSLEEFCYYSFVFPTTSVLRLGSVNLFLNSQNEKRQEEAIEDPTRRGFKLNLKKAGYVNHPYFCW